MATQEELEARVAAREASHADYRAVLAAVNALGANQRDHALDLAAVKTDLAAVKIDVAAVKTDVVALKADVAAVKTDLAAVKTDVAGVKTDVAGLKTQLADFRTETRATFRSVAEHLAEIRDLIVGRHNGR